MEANVRKQIHKHSFEIPIESTVHLGETEKARHGEW
jgi:hypothetical protein